MSRDHLYNLIVGILLLTFFIVAVRWCIVPPTSLFGKDGVENTGEVKGEEKATKVAAKPVVKQLKPRASTSGKVHVTKVHHKRSVTKKVAKAERNDAQRVHYAQVIRQPQRNYARDLAECRALAHRVSGYTPEETVKGGLLGGAIGAAAGAAIGAVFGHPGKGAAVGAAAGGIGAGTYSAIEAEKKYKRAYIKCMKNRGYNVLN